MAHQTSHREHAIFYLRSQPAGGGDSEDILTESTNNLRREFERICETRAAETPRQDPGK